MRKSGLFSVYRLLLIVLLAAAATAVTFGQDTNASLSGTVTDPTGAAIPNATLTLTNQSTHVAVKQTADASGGYNFTNLTAPAQYTLSVSAQGFKSQSHTGISLEPTQVARVNVQLALGNAQQTITVSGTPSDIDYTSPQLGGSIAPETLQKFPLIVAGAPRSSVTVADMMPGVTTGASGNAYNTRIDGGEVSGDEALVDGATAMEGYMNQSGMVSLETDFGMSPDITSSVTVLTANYPAQYGNSTSGQLIVQTRAGGDQFHGSAYEYLANTALNAYQYGTPAGNRKPVDQENDFGANLGGPLSIPGLTGRRRWAKSYFYFNWEGFRENGGTNNSTLSIPSLADRTGNFSAAGSQLYYPNDPAKYGALAGTAIPNNQIDPRFEDPVAKAWMAALPTPTSPGELNNYFIPHAGQGSLTNQENVLFGRVDVNLGNMDHLYYTSWWQLTGINTESNLPIAVSTASPASPENAVIERLNWEHNFSGTMNNHATIGYLNRNEGYFALNGKAALPTIAGVANPAFKPQFNFGGGYSQLGSNNPPTSAFDKTTRGTWAFNDVFTKVKGSHTITAGFEWRLAGTSIHLGGNEGGTFTFNPDTTGNQACPNSSCPGDAAASFFLGAVSNANVNYYNIPAVYPRQPGYAVYGGDSWRVTPKLTLDYSLRWDYISPMREKYNNFSFFDPNGLNPGAVTASGKELRGSLAFAGNKWGAASYGAPYPEQRFLGAFAPRLGLAYAVDQKTVIHAGWGIYYGQAFYPGWGAGLSEDGLNKTLNLNERPSGPFQVPALYLSSGLSPAQVGYTGENISPAYDNGQSPLYRPRDGNHRPYSFQWNLTIQRQLPKDIALTVSYVGTKGTHLPSALNPINVLNPHDPRLLAMGPALATDYTGAGGKTTFGTNGVTSPYAGWAGQMTGCSPTMAQALVPYPQYCSVLQGLNEQHGTSEYESFQAEVQRPFEHNLFLLGSFTYSRLDTNASYSTQAGSGDTGTGNNGLFSPYDEARAWAYAPDNVPIAGQVSIVYNLPVGHGQRFLNYGGIRNVILGGWQVSPLYRYEYGTPIWFTSSSCPTATLVPQFRESCVPGEIPGVKARLQSRNGFHPAATGGRYLNPAAFESNFSTFGYTGYGHAVSNVYGSDYQDLDTALTKNTKIGEKTTLILAANVFNTLNNHYFVYQGGGPGLPFVNDVAAPGNSFGTWNGTVSSARVLQISGRLQF